MFEGIKEDRSRNSLIINMLSWGFYSPVSVGVSAIFELEGGKENNDEHKPRPFPQSQ